LVNITEVLKIRKARNGQPTAESPRAERHFPEPDVGELELVLWSIARSLQVHFSSGERPSSGTANGEFFAVSPVPRSDRIARLSWAGVEVPWN
jgi:hypothetical protein